MKKWLLRIGAALGALVVLVLLAVFTTVDSTPFQRMGYYHKMMATIDSLPDIGTRGDTMLAGWAKVNLTPPKPVPIAIADSRNGRSYERVEDSIWVRAFVFDNGATKAAIVTADLLIIPPTVTVLLDSMLQTIGFRLSQVYLSATHTHNSIGAWGPGYVGKRFAGKYDQAVVDHIARCIVQAVKAADMQKQPAQLSYAEQLVPSLVFNRLVGDSGTTDPQLQVLKVANNNGKQAILVRYSAHATCLPANYMNLHRDYPGRLVDLLETADSVDMAAYVAGAVGSMGPCCADLGPKLQIDSLATALSQQVRRLDFKPISDKVVAAIRMPLYLREQHFRVSDNIRFRPWVTKKVVGDFPLEVELLRLGNLIWVGLPCDYSGELSVPLWQAAQQKGLQLSITSFNGGYMGYITHDKWYHLDAYETRTMNWYGPYNGQYTQTVVSRMMDKCK
ncbi:MAG: neutral/alkaline non-lysosomal ceramidase N-terminal domain-containing protein [Chitinophagales bacterium]|nr:neutral/alkaline non-lysosomal ceramidase N-terminal domain-containing protein [Chitinophagales bacterium]